ncbi:MAG: formylglycine-generating enzyme family protein [Bacteroidia bacterium]|nr:formylglycine-generating enzyme family protein [Bacteroidia bacterium]
MTSYTTYTETRITPNFQMIRIPGGTFQMGGADDQASGDEKPVHSVTVPDFYLGQYPVTQALWEAVMGENPARFKGETRPVENVSWNECRDFIQKLNARTGKTYRLPAEAEWEYAARGGSYSEGYIYAGSDKLKDVGWYNENSGGETHPVGQLSPNELGLYDLSGNIWEWCEDDWHDTYKGAPTDGGAWIDSAQRGSRRVMCGGGWSLNALYCRVSYRYGDMSAYRNNHVGLRLACSASHLDAMSSDKIIPA